MMDTATAARALNATLLGGNVLFKGVAIDSRAVGADELFFALRGERFDGHDFVASAFARGAAAAVVDAEVAGGIGGNLLAVDDTRRALGELAAHWRRRFGLPVAAIVGSNGKTTVKEMTAAILRAQFGAGAVLATSGNLNNEIGLPLTVLRLRAAHRVAVLELGMNHAGETAQLAAIAAPTVALINNAQREHQEFMRGVADVAREHSAVLEALAAQGTAVLNADDAHCGDWLSHVERLRAGGRDLSILRFGLDAHAEVTGRWTPADSGSTVEIVTPRGHCSVRLAIPGRHSVANALAATATALAAGAGIDAVRRGLEDFRPVRGRLQVLRGLHGSTVIDDTYNANPDSVRAAIDVLADAGGERWLVLGDMGEVGAGGADFHREVGAYAKACGIERLLATGGLSAHAVAAFGAGAALHADPEAIAAVLRRDLVAGICVLVKGSRFMRMERVVAALADVPTDAR